MQVPLGDSRGWCYVLSNTKVGRETQGNISVAPFGARRSLGKSGSPGLHPGLQAVALSGLVEWKLPWPYEPHGDRGG